MIDIHREAFLEAVGVLPSVRVTATPDQIAATALAIADAATRAYRPPGAAPDDPRELATVIEMRDEAISQRDEAEALIVEMAHGSLVERPDTVQCRAPSLAHRLLCLADRIEGRR